MPLFCLRQTDAKESRNGKAPAIGSGSVDFAKHVTGVVAVDYETREGSAKPGKDFKFTQGTLVSQINNKKGLHLAENTAYCGRDRST